MNLVDRVQAILLKPKDTWAVIVGEGGDVPSIYKNYLVYLAAIPAVATFIGLSLVGAGAFGVSFRVPILTGLVNMVVGFVLSLAMIYVLSLIANALAPTFKGEKNALNAFKLVAYGSTAGLVGGVFNLLPALSMLGVLTALYSIYLIYTGIPVLMKAPEDKALGYTAVLIVCGIVAAVIVGAVSSIFTSGSGMKMGAGMSSSDTVRIKVPGSDITIDTAKIEAMGKQVEAASKKMEEAQARGDSAAAGKAMGEMMGAALGGGKGGKPFEPEALQRFVPAKLGAMERTAIEARSDNAMGMTFSSVTSEFRNQAARVEVKVQDLGAVPALALAMGAWAQSTVSRETQDEVEKVFQRDGASIKEEYRKDGSRAEMSMMLANGVMVDPTGNGVSMDSLRAAMAATRTSGTGRLGAPE